MEFSIHKNTQKEKGQPLIHKVYIIWALNTKILLFNLPVEKVFLTYLKRLNMT